ncbi:MAG: GH3 auxin-responsive promoter family protein [Saprospiraceae bacterium]|nr:GH3 auxin-responsive promoter family protein [Saprospiraceae bacterium]
MSLLGTLIRRGAQLGSLAERPRLSPHDLQYNQLLTLLQKAKRTAFGRYHGFHEALLSPDPPKAFVRQVPATDYQGIYDRWWHKAHLEDQPDVCWPGVIPYYALSSGTSQSSTKYIPVTEDMLRDMKRGSRRLFFDITKFGLSSRQFTKQMLMVGSCTMPKREGLHWTGDLSGIIGLNRPIWLERSYRPGRHITDLPEWSERIERIVAEAPTWDIGFSVSNPMWLQLILEKIVERYKLRNIHELWPNYEVLVHGGVFFEPYRPTLEQLFGRSMHYVDSYMASEGFFAYQNRPDTRAMRMLTDCGVYFEFVPFNDENFDENGDLRSAFPPSLSLEEVSEGAHYATLISTSAGAWRYLLGDTIQFTNLRRCEFRLTGRTKQFLSVCGEHLSIDNLNAAVHRADEMLNAGVREFTVAGVREGSYWAHQWYVSVENPAVSPEAFAQVVDAELRRLNDDYAVERDYVLRDVRVQLLPNEIFLEWLGKRGKFNGQAKIPRVMKGEQLANFMTHINNKGVATRIETA